ncbi:transposase family protein [Streptomyces sp. NPDC051453]|uniref:transposase family protein n=1 Tax=Streptomyces sp. NPDC051453 TaxID=3154941 RepID=UPI00343266F4
MQCGRQSFAVNEVLPQLEELLFSSVEGVLVESVEVADAVVRVEARTSAVREACPDCGCWSGRIHGSYLRFPRDLPAVGKVVVLSLRVRRFVCAEDCCPRKTFGSFKERPQCPRSSWRMRARCSAWGLSGSAAGVSRS